MKIKDITRHHPTAIAAVSLLLLCSSCASNGEGGGGGERETQEEAEPTIGCFELSAKQIDAVRITLGTMERRSLSNTVRATGVLGLDPQSRADVSPLLGGVVSGITVREGDAVRAGETVAYIESTTLVEMQKEYVAAVNEAAAATEELRRQQLLTAEGAGVEKTLREAEMREATATATKTALAQQLRQVGIDAPTAARIQTRMPVRSPISGTVGKIGVSTGSYADMQTVLMTIVDNTKLHADIKVYEKDVARLAIGQSVDMVLTNDRSVQLRGEIYAINSTFDDDTRAVRVHVSITSAANDFSSGSSGGSADERGAASSLREKAKNTRGNPQLIEGMSVTAVVNVGEHEAPAMPDEAIISLEGKKYLALLKAEDVARYKAFLASLADGNPKTETVKGGNAGDDDVMSPFKFRLTEIVTGSSSLGYTEVTLIEELPDDALYVKRGAYYVSSMIEGGEEDE